jgi:hypothetical protein
MELEGKYIYCIISAEQERNFGPIGVGGRNDEVLTIGYNDLSMVVSNHPLMKFVVNRENVLAHEKVIEEVMKEFDEVLPVRFGIIASNADEIRSLLYRRYREFKNMLKDMDHKIELGLKGIWKNMDVIFKEISEENADIKKAKETIQNDSDQDNLEVKVTVGKMVQAALAKKQEKEAEKIIEALRRTAFEYKLNKTIGDEMFINAAFLVDRGREKEFDNIVDDLSVKYKQRITFWYSGPLPVFNFVNVTIYPEEWER